MKQGESISAIVAAYRAADTLPQALDSIATQQWPPGELIVVDDASPDRTSHVAEAWLGEKARSISGRMLRLSHNRGPAAARNVGLAEASGTWVAFLDADDAWLPWRLALQREALQKADPDAVLIGGRLVLMDSPFLPSPPPTCFLDHPGSLKRMDRSVFIDENPFPTSTVLARRDAILQIGGFDERFRGPEDIDLWIRLAAVGPTLLVEWPLARYRERPGSLSMDPDRFLPQILNVYAKAFAPSGALYPWRSLQRRAVASRLTSAAWTYAACGRRMRALILLFRSWRVWPGRLKVEHRDRWWRLRMLGRLLLPKELAP